MIRILMPRLVYIFYMYLRFICCTEYGIVFFQFSCCSVSYLKALSLPPTFFFYLVTTGCMAACWLSGCCLAGWLAAGWMAVWLLVGWLLAASCWMLAFGCWLAGCWLAG